jgi:hypothetical protein
MYYEYGSGITAFPATPSSSNITTTGKVANVIPATAASGTYTWYTGENKRGTSSTATTAYLKDFLHTPTDNSSQYYCTYIRVQAKKNDSTTVMNYYLYVGADGTTDFNVKRNWDYTLNATMGGNEAAQQAFMGIDGRIRMSTSNCYIVAPGGSITIPVNVKGNANCPLPPDASSTVLAGTGLEPFHSTVTSVSVLWQTATDLISVGSTFNSTNQTVTISAPSPTATGNGVIVAKDASSNVLWSWHIWVADYNPNTGTTYNFNPSNPLTFMDRNLGATSNTVGTVTTYGLHYQWGRKDPFPNASTLTSSTDPTLYGTQTTITKTLLAENTVCNLDKSILNPLTYYYTTDHTNIHFDWYTTTDDAARSYQNDKLWGGASATTPTAKTIFDPCPAGWRVPPWKNSYSPWSVFGSNEITVAASGGLWPTDNYGITWTSPYSAGYYPAAGYRTVGSGALDGVGSYGFYWSASSDSGSGFDLTFLSSLVYPASYNNRANGFSVRCVQEF